MDNNIKDINILIVDDDTFVLNFVSELLKEFGYRAIPSDNPFDALNIFQKEECGIVLTDIKMQGISGIELLNKIHDINPEIPVILMTADAELHTAIEAIQKGAFDFVCKPFKPGHIINCMKKALKHYNALQAEKDYKSLLEISVKNKTEELDKTLIELRSLNREIIERLATAAEFREILKILTEGDNRTKPTDFDPNVLKAFLKVSEIFYDIYEAYQE